MEVPMVERAEFFRIADEIVEEGREPSQRSIRDRLVRGGSFSDLGPLYVEWAAMRGFRPRPTKDALPDHLRDKLAKLAAEIWSDGVRSGALGAQNELNRLMAERDALKLALTETSTRADALEDLMNLGSPGIGEAAGTPVQAPGESSGSDRFWNRVMMEVFDLLGERELDARTIVEGLSEKTVEEAAGRDGGWGPVRLAHKMRIKIKRNQLFEEPQSGLFCRRAQAAK